MPSAINLFVTFEVYNMALNSKNFKNILAPNTDAIIEKFNGGLKLHELEKSLICTYIREELKADIVSLTILKYAGYPITDELKNHFWETVDTAKRVISAFEGKI
jgi:hypothetical protein